MLIFIKRTVLFIILPLPFLFKALPSLPQNIITSTDSLAFVLLQEPQIIQNDTIDPISKKSAKTTIKNDLIEREIKITRPKTSFQFNYGGRIQTRFDVVHLQEKNAEYVDKLYLRRVRFKSDGHIFTPKLEYKLEVDIIGSQILDAVLKWNFNKNLGLMAGQTKLRGNRERVISSQNLQFVDRSLLNARYNLDRDIGFWLTHKFKAGIGQLRQVVSVTKGEGRSIFKENPMTIDNGLDYTARLEYLPFGAFKNKGDYKGGDLEREPKPKLSIGVTFDFNDKAVRSNGQLGPVVDQPTDLKSWFIDMMFKFQGFSLMTEFVDRKMTEIDGQTGELTEVYHNSFYTGNAFNTQAGYLFKRNYELAARYTIVRPKANDNNNDMTEYTLGLSKYIVDHHIKAQTDFSILHEKGRPITHIFRLQFELSL